MYVKLVVNMMRTKYGGGGGGGGLSAVRTVLKSNFTPPYLVCNTQTTCFTYMLKYIILFISI
jgi:hypothetical protein